MNATSERVLKALSRLEAAPAKPANDPVRRRGIELVQVLVRYLGPNGERWAGCGKTPRWVREVEEEGGDREDYRIF